MLLAVVIVVELPESLQARVDLLTAVQHVVRHHQHVPAEVSHGRGVVLALRPVALQVGRALHPPFDVRPQRRGSGVGERARRCRIRRQTRGEYVVTEQEHGDRAHVRLVWFVPAEEWLARGCQLGKYFLNLGERVARRLHHAIPERVHGLPFLLEQPARHPAQAFHQALAGVQLRPRDERERGAERDDSRVFADRFQRDGPGLAHREEVGIAARLQVTQEDIELPGPLVADAARLAEERGGRGGFERVGEPFGFVASVDEDGHEVHSGLQHEQREARAVRAVGHDRAEGPVPVDDGAGAVRRAPG